MKILKPGDYFWMMRDNAANRFQIEEVRTYTNNKGTLVKYQARTKANPYFLVDARDTFASKSELIASL